MEDKVKRPGVERSLDESLTPGERLLIWRRRMEYTQIEAARLFNVSIFSYKLAEYDKAPDFKYKKGFNPQLRDYERCLIYRKRSGLTQHEIAEQIGIGRYWLRMQELGQISCDRLLEYWEK